MQTSIYKDVHLVVDYLELGECNSHIFLKKGVNTLVSERPNDVCQVSTTNLGVFYVSYYP